MKNKQLKKKVEEVIRLRNRVFADDIEKEKEIKGGLVAEELADVHARLVMPELISLMKEYAKDL